MKKSHCSRRDFLNCLGISLFSAFKLAKSRPSLSTHQEIKLLPPRPSLSSLALGQSRSRVIIVEGRDIQSLVWRGLEALGLPQDYFRDKRVIIKPNSHWSEEYPSTTDPSSILPIIDFLRQRTSGNITVADGSGKDLPSYRAAFDFIGFEKILAPKGADIVPLDIWKLDDFITIRSPQWSVLEAVAVHRLIYNTPILISLTCLKRHGSPHLTAALKSNVGATCARSRYYLHFYTREKMREAIAEVADAVRPEITIIDARDILVKKGPMFLPDKANLKKGVNKLLISTDPAALDRIASQVMAEHDETFRFEQFKPTLDHASRMKLGNVDLDYINVVNLKA